MSYGCVKFYLNNKSLLQTLQTKNEPTRIMYIYKCLIYVLEFLVAFNNIYGDIIIFILSVSLYL